VYSGAGPDKPRARASSRRAGSTTSMVNSTDRRLQRHALAELGYESDLVLDDFDVWNGGDQVVRADSVAFAAEPADMRTAAVICEADVPGHDWPGFAGRSLDAAGALAAPVLLKSAGDSVRLYGLEGRDPRPRPLSEWVAPVELARFSRRAGPDAVLRAKQDDRQLALIPFDAGNTLSATAARLRGDLIGRLDTRLRALEQEFLSTGLEPRPALRLASRSLVAALTCLMIRDKQRVLVSDESLPDVALQRYPQYFGWYSGSTTTEQLLLVEAIRDLGDGITYRGLSPEVVSDVYESVLVDETLRKDHGVYYTPAPLARLVLEALPVEEIPPADRVVLDMACGSGTLLLAAYERLQRLLPSGMQAQERHRELTSRLHGWDQDALAVHISQLALLLHDLPGGNGWLVEERDALDPAPLAWGPPTIVVTNPPWRTPSPSETDRRAELADRFVVQALDRLAPGGLLGMILPAGWLTSSYSRDVRDRVRRETDLFEVWRLPETVFGSARAPSAVLCARKGPRSAGAWRVERRVGGGSGEWRRFAALGVADETTLVPSGTPLGSGALSAALARASMATLGDYATVTFGPQPTRLLLNGLPTPPAADRWLARAGDLKAFGDVPEEALAPATVPVDFRFNSPRKVVLAPKVLASATRWVDNPWRLQVAIDTRGVAARQSLFCVVPNKDLPLAGQDALLALMALLGSAVASGWVDEVATKRSARTQDLKSLPVPRDLDWGFLAALGRTLHEHHGDPAGLAEPLLELDDAVMRFYRLPALTMAALGRRFAGRPAPEGLVRFRADETAPSWQAGAANPLSRRPGQGEGWSPGTVLGVDAETVTLWVAGLTELAGVRLQVPARLPGALVREGATFEVEADRETDLPHATYRFQRAAWMADEQIGLSGAL